jgi:hypothetical protein
LEATSFQGKAGTTVLLISEKCSKSFTLGGRSLAGRANSKGAVAMPLSQCALRAIAVSILTACLALGCSHAKVSDEHTAAGPVAGAAPDMIYVGAVDLGSTTVKSDPGTLTGRPRLFNFHQKDPQQELERLEQVLRDDLVRDLNAAGLPAQPYSETTDITGAPTNRPPQGWLVRGAFMELDQGNRLQRTAIGFGAGNSDAKLYIKVIDLAHPEEKYLLESNASTTGPATIPSGATAAGGAAGAIVAHSPWGMVAKFAIERNASDRDIHAVAQAVADELVTYAGKSGSR